MAAHRNARSFQLLLLLSVFVVATCGLIYELIAGTLASYLLGDSVTQFSTIIGTYLFAMGIGSFLSRYFKNNLLSWFITIELLVGMVGGFSAGILFILFEQVVYFRIILYTFVVVTGTLVGLEIPLLMRILKDRLEFSDLVSRIFTFDYIGALFASLLFPLIFVPYLGLLRTAFFFGLLNVAVAWVVAFRFRNEITSYPRLRWASVLCVILLASGFAASDKLTQLSESLTYPDNIVYAKSSPYQRIVLTHGSDWRLFLNGNLQFSSADEYRYHEALIHPGLSRVTNPKSVLVLGGGDGMAVREILKYPGVEQVTLVDLDKAMTDLFQSNETLTRLNDGVLTSPKVKVINADAFVWIREQKDVVYDFIAVDFPDPSNYSLGKLYTTSFYTELKRILSDNGCAVVQSTSPYVARKSFWIIDATLRKAGLETNPYHCYVPSFGEWGFVLTFKNRLPGTMDLPAGRRFIDEQTVNQMYVFPPDMSAIPAEANTLNNQVLVNTFEKEWARYIR